MAKASNKKQKKLIIKKRTYQQYSVFTRQKQKFII